MSQLVEFKGSFDFWIGLAEGLWKHILLPGGTPEEVSTYAAALNHTLDSLIDAAIPESRFGGSSSRHPPSPFTCLEPGACTRILKLLDLMVFTRRTQNLGQLITLVSQPQGNLLDQYQNLATSFIPGLKTRYQQYSRSYFPVPDAFLRTFVEKWLQDLLGSPSK